MPETGDSHRLMNEPPLGVAFSVLRSRETSSWASFIARFVPQDFRCIESPPRGYRQFGEGFVPSEVRGIDAVAVGLESMAQDAIELVWAARQRSD